MTGLRWGLNWFWIGFIRVWIRSPPPLDLDERALVTRLLHWFKPNKILINTRVTRQPVRSLNPAGVWLSLFGAIYWGFQPVVDMILDGVFIHVKVPYKNPLKIPQSSRNG